MKASILPVATVLCIFAMSPASNAATIYYDSFAGTNGVALAGRSPEENNGVTGAKFSRHNNTWDADIQGNRLRLGADNGASLDITTSGTFIQPQVMQISALLNIGTISGNSSSNISNTGQQRGVGLGFYQGTSVNAGAGTNWRGLLLGTDGRLILGQMGVAGAAAVGYVAEIARGINIAIDHTLSYRVDTSTGDISDIYLDGVLQADVATTLFSTNMNRVGLVSSSGTGDTFSTFDNFLVESVPEPSSVALLGIFGGLALLRRHR